MRGEVYSIPKMANIKTKAVRDRLGDKNTLPSLEQAKETIANIRIGTARKAFIDILSMHINSNTLTPYEGEGMHFEGYQEWISAQSMMFGTHLEEAFKLEEVGKMLTEVPKFLIRSRYNFHRDEIDRVRVLFEAEKTDVTEEEIHRSLREQANGVSNLLISDIDFQKLLRPAKGSLV